MIARVTEMVERAFSPGGAFNFDQSLLRVLNWVARVIVEGSPVSREQVARLAGDAGVDLATADQFLAGTAERDAHGNIVGIAPGLTLTPTPHRLAINGKKLFAWCAEDAVIAAAFLGRTVEIESRSPLRKETVRLTVSPEGIESVSPKDTALSMVVVDTDQADLSSVAAIWGVFCHHNFFFPSRAEAEEWARGKENVEIISPDEAYDIAKPIARAFTASPGLDARNGGGDAVGRGRSAA